LDDTRSRIAHLYRRAGFGARPDELDAAAARGYQATVDSLLAGLSGPDPTGDKVAVPTLVAAAGAGAGSQPQDPAARMAANLKREMAVSQADQALQTWWLNRMIVTSTPLREKLTLLWHGHFATGFEKVRNAGYMYRQNQLLRTRAGGNFETLTQAVAKDAAMMAWLDTQTDVASHPNENFARELMELFTLGLGNYTEDDVKEAARCFTGWSINRATGQYVFRTRQHDFGVKTLLGHTGTWNGDDAVHIVTRHPASARWIVAKLWSHLVYPVRPDDRIIAELSVAYGFDLDITNLLRAIFLHPEFTGAKARAGLVKQPIEYVVGIARAFGLDATGQGAGDASGAPAGRQARPVALPLVLRGLAQRPFSPPSVGGWPQNEYWLTTASAQLRLQYGYAVALTADLGSLASLAPAARPAALAHLLSVEGWGPTTTAALNHVAADPPALVAIALSAPEYVLN
jgi:uncharacterized protein (DUF1800 family)